jgi:hypothetical protein
MASKRFRDAVGINPDRVVAAALDAALGDTQSRSKKHHPGRALAAGAALAAAAAVGQKRMPRLAKVPLRMGLHKLGDMTHVDELADALRDRLVGHDDEPESDDYVDDELEEEGFEDDEEGFEDDEEGFDDGDEGFDDEDEGFDDEPEDDDGPRGEGDEADEDEPEDDEPDEDPDAAVEDEPDDELEDEPDDGGELEPDEEDDAEPEEEDEDDAEPDEEDEQIAARSVDLGVTGEGTGRRAHRRVPDLFEALRTPHRRPPVMRRASHDIDPARRPPEPDQDGSQSGGRDRSKKQTSKAARSKAARA